ncbi:MAG: hypothetical protein Q9219_000070 [cf. Caloplaca sp. 3 TL-2023]
MQSNVLKLEYQLIFSKWGELEDTASIIDFERFIVRCIQSYWLSVCSCPVDETSAPSTERLPGDDAGLLAAIGLIRLTLLTNHQKALLQAVGILQYLTQKSPFNYEALVVLTLLYTKIGAGWLAAECYSRLSIKNIQFPTLSWLLCTRISSIHPHPPNMKFKPPSEEADADPVQHVRRALDYHIHLCETDQQEISDFLEAGQYASLLQAMGDSAQNQLGFTKYMLLVEWARIERLSGAAQQLDLRRLTGQLLQTNWLWKRKRFTDLSGQLPVRSIDNRDRSSIPHWEGPGAVSLEEMLIPGGWPSHKWLSGQLLIAGAFDAARKQNVSLGRVDILRTVKDTTNLRESSTPVEIQQVGLARTCDLLMGINVENESKSRATNENESAVHEIDKIQAWLADANAKINTGRLEEKYHLWEIVENIKAPDWEFFHTSYTDLDSCLLIETTMDCVEAQNRKVRFTGPDNAEEKIGMIRQLCQEYRTSLHAAVVEMGKYLSDDRRQEDLLYSIISRQGVTENQDPIGYWLLHLFVDEQYAQGIVTRLQLAWKEAVMHIAELTRPKISA